MYVKRDHTGAISMNCREFGWGRDASALGGAQRPAGAERLGPA